MPEAHAEQINKNMYERARDAAEQICSEYRFPFLTPPQGQTPGFIAGEERRRKAQNHMFYVGN